MLSRSFSKTLKSINAQPTMVGMEHFCVGLSDWNETTVNASSNDFHFPHLFAALAFIPVRIKNTRNDEKQLELYIVTDWMGQRR